MAEPQYLDFDLELWREGDAYRAAVRNSPEGSSEMVTLKWPYNYSDTERENLLLKLENAVLSGRGRRSGLPSTEEKILREFGSEVFRVVLKESDDVADKFRRSLDKVARDPKIAGLRVKLRLKSPDLALLPWEYMFDGSDRSSGYPYVCLRNTSPVVRYLDEQLREGGTVQTEGPLRILAMVANPPMADGKRLDTEAERRSIDEAWKTTSNSAVELRWVRSGKRDDLAEMILQGPWHIFHFIGHGGTDLVMGSEGNPFKEAYVVMEDGAGGAQKVSARDLANMFDGERNLTLAVLNCCESGGGTFANAGAEFVRAGVPIAIAMQYSITNGAAVRFASMFYKTLAAGKSIERALTEARKHVRAESDVEWGIPVLFASTRSSVLFEIKPGVAAPEPRVSQAQEALRQLFA